MVQGGSRKGKKKAVEKKDTPSGDEFEDLRLSDISEEVLPDDLEVLSQDASPEDILAEAEDRFLRSAPSTVAGPSSNSTKKRGANVYVVFCGRKTGIFESWAATHAQTSGFRGGSQQGYSTMEEATAAWQHACAIGATKNSPTQAPISPTVPTTARAPVSRNSKEPHTGTPSRQGPPDPRKLLELFEAFQLRETKGLKQANNPRTTPPPTISTSGPSSQRSLHQHVPKASGSRTASATGDNSRSTSISRSTASIRKTSDSWYIVVQGLSPGVYADSNSALAALGRGRDRSLEQVATSELAYKYFTLAFMNNLVVANAF